MYIYKRAFFSREIIKIFRFFDVAIAENSVSQQASSEDGYTTTKTNF